MSSFIPHTEEEKREMLKAIGMSSLKELFAPIPRDLLLKRDLNLPDGITELELTQEIAGLSKKITPAQEYISFLGAGCYDHFIPAAVDHIAARSEFCTSYTPYQAEASQGMLQVLFEYQTLISELTGMDISNASLYDGATALGEAINLAYSVNHGDKILLSETVHPEYRKVIETYFRHSPFSICPLRQENGRTDLDPLKKALSGKVSAVVIQNPNFFGCLEEIEIIDKLTHNSGALLIMLVDPISLGLLKPPSEFHADIVVGEGQSLGSPLAFGGSTLGIFACRKEHMRKVPGRIVGQTEDKKGRRGFVLTLQTREQHIRREKATSNICTNQSLHALRATVYLCLLGKKGLREVAGACLQKAHYAAEKISELPGWELKFASPFFKEFVVKSPSPPEEVNEHLLSRQIIGGLDLGRFYPELKDCLLVCVTEKRKKREIDTLVNELKRFS